MKSLREELEVTNEVLEINSNDITQSIKIAFKDNKYRFYLNSELIDVNNRFRIFKFNNKKYIVKKSSLSSGLEEVELAKKAYKILNNTIISDYKIKVILPKLKEIDNEAYIISEYKGVSLQECLYTKNINNPLSIIDLKKLLSKFLELGILYRGFLPRNTIINNNIIYLLDWEDVIFCQEKEKSVINKLWETNFLLNWSYFYDFNKLNDIIKPYKGKEADEAPLIKYEKKFGQWINSKLDGVLLRNKIMETVFYAEKNINLNDDNFYILPNDMAHLVSDIFNTDIDVLFDVTSYVMRKHDEQMYCKLLSILSTLIAYLYKNDYDIKKVSIKIILIMIELASSKCERSLNFTSYLDILENKELNNFDLINALNNKDNFKFILKEKITKLIEVFNGETGCNIDVTELSDYILNL